MLNYFPQFVTEMLMPPIPDPPKYQLFVYSALFSSEIMEHPEVLYILILLNSYSKKIAFFNFGYSDTDDNILEESQVISAK